MSCIELSPAKAAIALVVGSQRDRPDPREIGVGTNIILSRAAAMLATGPRIVINAVPLPVTVKPAVLPRFTTPLTAVTVVDIGNAPSQYR